MNDLEKGLIVQTFMTHRMTDASIMTLATDRGAQQQKVMDAVERSLKAMPAALQHCVIYGPRGFGKSFMTRLIQIATRALAAELGMAVPFLLLPEEQHNLTRNPHALPNYIAQRLSDLRTGEDGSWSGSMFQWPDPEKEPALWDSAVETLEAELDRYFGAKPGMAIVVIENFDVLLSSVFKESAAEQRLRKWLDRSNNRVMLIATATGSVDMEYDRPLFHAFQSVRLLPWSQASCITYFNRRREAEGKAPLNPEMEAKARAVADFIGGNPRLAQLLADVLETQDALSVAGTMNALADKLSDYYRRRIDDLAPLSQGLLDALIRGGEPASQTELANRVGAHGQSQIARVMGELERSDIINGIASRDSRETLYRVTDRVFVHFYRLRQGNQLVIKTPLNAILEFLRAFYSADEKRRHALMHLKEGRLIEGRLFADLALENGPALNLEHSYLMGLRHRLARTYLCFDEQASASLERVMNACESSPEQYLAQLKSLHTGSDLERLAATMIEAHALSRMGLTEDANQQLLILLDDANDPPTRCVTLFELIALSHFTGDKEKVSQFIDQMIDLPLNTLPDILKGVSLRLQAWNEDLQRSSLEALPLAIEAVEYTRCSGSDYEAMLSLLVVARVYKNLADDAAVTEYANEALSLAERLDDLQNQKKALGLLVNALCESGPSEALMDACSKQIQLAQRLNDLKSECAATSQIAWSLHGMGRFDESVEMSTRGILLAKSSKDDYELTFCLRVMAISLLKIQDYPSAIIHAQRAAECARAIQDYSEESESLRIWAKAEAMSGDINAGLSIAFKSMAAAKLINDSWTMAWCARDLIGYATSVPSPAAIDAFYEQVKIEVEALQVVGHTNDWAWWMSDLFCASARASYWKPLDMLLSEQRSEIDDHKIILMKEVGETLSDIGQTYGFEAGSSAMQAVIPRLVHLSEGCDDKKLPEWLNAVVSGFSNNCRDVAFINTFTDLLRSQEISGFSEAADLLASLSHVLSSVDPEATLLRMNPDVALWLRTSLDLPEPTVRSGRKSRR